MLVLGRWLICELRSGFLFNQMFLGWGNLTKAQLYCHLLAQSLQQMMHSYAEVLPMSTSMLVDIPVLASQHLYPLSLRASA